MTPLDLKARGEAAQTFVRDAGMFAKAAFLDRSSLTIRTKGAQDWVTNVDTEVETLIRSRLAEAFPGEPILGEEAGQSQGDASGGTWVIDPIDGTTCFLLGLPQWCVVLGYVVDAEPVVAAIYDPIADELFSAVAGGGTFVNGRPVRVAAADSISQGLIAVGAAQQGDPAKSGQFIATLVQEGGMFIRVGACALALSYVAAGRLLAAYEPLVSPWDDLAGMLLVREAGGRTNAFAPTIITDSRRPVLAAAPQLWDRVAPLL